MEIGNYTVSHDYFLDLTDAERQQEFATEVAAAQQTFVGNMGVASTACEPVPCPALPWVVDTPQWTASYARLACGPCQWSAPTH